MNIGAIKNLYNAGSVMDEALAVLKMVRSAFDVTLESMDSDGLQPEGKENPALSINFGTRFRMYSDTLHLILQNMDGVLDSLEAETNSIFAACPGEKL